MKDKKQAEYSNKNHPERLPDEVFITNANDSTEYSDDGQSSYQMIGWKTKRKGQVAYDVDGEPLGKRWEGAFPVFVKQSEIGARGKEILERLLPST